METTAWLDNLVSLVAANLARAMARLMELGNGELQILESLAKQLGIDERPRVDEEQVRTFVWEPVAEQCVVTFLRGVLGQLSGHSESALELSEEQLETLTDELCDTELAASVGLANPDVRLAMHVTKKAVLAELDPNVPQRLSMDGRDFTLERTRNGVSVSLVKASIAPRRRDMSLRAR